MAFKVQYRVNWQRASKILAVLDNSDYVPEIGSFIGYQYWVLEVAHLCCHPFSGDKPFIEVELEAPGREEFEAICD